MSTFSAAAKAVFVAAAATASGTALISGTLDILDAGGAVLATVGLGTPTASGAVTTMGGFPKTVNGAATGTAASARYRKSDAGDWVTGMSVGTSGAEVNLSALTITAGLPVTVNSANLTHVAG